MSEETPTSEEITPAEEGTNFQAAFDSKYIRAFELRGQAHKVKIAGVRIEGLQLPGQKDKKKAPILKMEGKAKELVLNKTNAKKIAEMLGTQIIEKWVGREITIYPTKTKFGQNVVDCIRVK